MRQPGDAGPTTFSLRSTAPSVTREDFLRALFLAAAFTAATAGAASADPNVAGRWQANMESGVTINMDMTPDGNWSSETLQRRKAVRQMKGTYTQRPANDYAGVLVFTPSETTSGKALTETDDYVLAKGGKELRLTSGGDTMVFRKQSRP